ncbi:protein-export chaperone SecB [Stakelama saccharophila]|uniref:Protein-export protein SecB n=1 Tax=Stakelama saccharophila TaxID=3075605 RepID=A0ABZ0BF31_9SPHN|nr:protein-export chaperone SecB [Stakelama sp. W311]WNO55074.1 protein-export chaperone SecB [Stakelama sp. W311]
MAEQENGANTGSTAPNGADTAAENAPMANVLSQYVKDLSFENPNAPAVFQKNGQPQIDVQFNIGANQVGDGVHEVILKIEAKATVEGQTAFLVDLSYAGLFGLRNVPEEHVRPFMLAEAPRILFPFARRVLADAVRDGGFAPLMLEPIDFNALFQQQAQEQGFNLQASGADIGQA